MAECTLKSHSGSGHWMPFSFYLQSWLRTTYPTISFSFDRKADSEGSDEQQWEGICSPLFTFLCSDWCGPVSPLDSLLEFLLNLTLEVFTELKRSYLLELMVILQIELLGRVGQEYLIDFPGL